VRTQGKEDQGVLDWEGGMTSDHTSKKDKLKGGGTSPGSPGGGKNTPISYVKTYKKGRERVGEMAGNKPEPGQKRTVRRDRGGTRGREDPSGWKTTIIQDAFSPERLQKPLGHEACGPEGS